MSRQYEWQLRKIAEGCCEICGRPRKHYARRCDQCRIKERVYTRRLCGSYKWKPGSRGTKPRIMVGA